MAYENIKYIAFRDSYGDSDGNYYYQALDKLRNRADGQVEKHRTLFTQRYLEPARDLVTRLDLVRRCFYLKVCEKLSRERACVGWRREVLTQLAVSYTHLNRAQEKYSLRKLLLRKQRGLQNYLIKSVKGCYFPVLCGIINE